MLKKREQDFLNLLLDQSDFQPASYFQKILQVSTKTVYSDLDKLEPVFSKNHLTLERVPRKGILLKGSYQDRENARLESTVYSSPSVDFPPHQRQFLIFADFLFSSQVKHYKDYANDFFVSYQSIKTDVDEIIFFLRKQGLNAEMTYRGFQLEGKEQDIQKAFKLYIETTEKMYHEKMMTSSFVDPRVELLVNRFIMDMEQKKKHILTSHSSSSLFLSLLIFLGRLSNGKHIDSSNDFLFKEIQKYQLYFMAIEFSDIVNREIGIVFQTSDLYYLCSLFLAHGVEPAMEEGDISETFKFEATGLINVMERLLDVDFSEDDYLFRAILAHIIPMVHRLKNGIFISNPLKDHIKQQYATMFTLIKFATSSLEKTFSIQLSEDEISFLTIHFQVAFEKIRSTKHILIVCSKGLATSQLIFNRIQQSLPESVVLEIVSEDRIHTTPLEEVDMIISTVPLKVFEIPIIYVSPLPSKEEMSQITSALSDINENEKTFAIPKYRDLSLLEKHLQDEFLFVNQNKQTKEEILDQLSEQYEALDFVYPSFRQSLYDREAQWSTELFTGVAMPHADPSAIKKTMISFYALETPVQWDTFPVHLVILLAIAEEDIEEAKALITLFNELLYSPTLIKHIAQSQTKEELRLRLVEGIESAGNSFPNTINF